MYGVLAFAALVLTLECRYMLLPIFTISSQVDPCESREDPVVCAALIQANVYIDLDDVLEAEREFWKVMTCGDETRGDATVIEALSCKGSFFCVR